jgi:hypothetical protein
VPSYLSTLKLFSLPPTKEAFAENVKKVNDLQQWNWPPHCSLTTAFWTGKLSQSAPCNKVWIQYRNEKVNNWCDSTRTSSRFYRSQIELHYSTSIPSKDRYWITSTLPRTLVWTSINPSTGILKWLKQRTVINLISPIGNTSQRMGVHASLNISEWDQVPWRSKYPLLTGHTVVNWRRRNTTHSPSLAETPAVAEKSKAQCYSTYVRSSFEYTFTVWSPSKKESFS